MSVILIADDNPHARRMGKQILTQEGCEVATASDGNEAMAYLENNRPSLVMADTRMPGPSGFDICRHVKSAESLAGVRVVLLAGPLEPFDPALAEEVRSDAVLHKPLDAYTLIETVKSLIGAGPQEKDAEIPYSAEGQDNAPEPGEAIPEPVEELVAGAVGDQEGSQPEVADEGLSATAIVEEAAGVVEVAEADAEAIAPLQAAELKSQDDPLADLVDIALGNPEPGKQKERIEQAVADVLEAAMPALAETITERVIEKLEED